MRNDVRRLRTERGWTQVQFAESLGVSRQTVNALETGKYDPSLPLAFRISALFQVSIEAIFFPGETDTPPTGGRR
ncbi:helix-turn-helix transcriptional regulator [Microbacterium lushaniae]|uniref:Helix-turn-helix transcriptional regulator n=2 Tax=Microbacterium lushaniae TaxID=2614639 RepID=A0A5J6L3V1_9MICO|nr:helix-turn-helix transcriptional regulator [Microbacterium lushaniae]QEW03022.1 helix-turn-helix transcriptional regulator [Microbacterium lushaniae]